MEQIGLRLWKIIFFKPRLSCRCEVEKNMRTLIIKFKSIQIMVKIKKKMYKVLWQGPVDRLIDKINILFYVNSLNVFSWK
jgi:hypothetical protein